MLSSKHWREVSPYLESALAMPQEERTAWLESIRRDDPELSALLTAFLDQHKVLEDEQFLEHEPTSMRWSHGLTGQSIGPYTLVAKIGEGGMGEIWLAERSDGCFERRVAIKFLRIALVGRGGEERFKREGSILARLAHPNVAELVDAGVSSIGQPYLVLEHIEGEQIDHYCDKHALGVRARVRLFLEVLAAVAHAHANLIVHRDLKPSNVLVRSDGRVKLLDFGIAKLLESDARVDGATALTFGGRPMTPEYAAPEQLTDGVISISTDVYGLGTLLYLLLTGQHPAGGGLRSHAELVRAIVEIEPTRPSDIVMPTPGNQNAAIANASSRAAAPEKLRRLLSGDLDTIITKALKKNPRERYVSADVMADDLGRFLRHQPISARPDTVAYRASKFIRRNRIPVVLAVMVLLATFGGVAGILIQTRSMRAQRDFALRQVERTAAINEFHNFLLSDAAPSGKPLTINELLARAETIVVRQHSVNDPNRVELMVSIGRQYSEQDDSASARRVLEEAYKLSRGLSVVSIRAEASCALALSLARDEEISRAETLLREGLDQLPEAPQFALERMACLQYGSEIAQEGNEIWKGVARAKAAQKVLRESPFDSDELEMHCWSDIAKAYGSAGQDLEAASAYERAVQLLYSLGRDRTATAVTMFNNWALELDQMGRPLDAEKLYRRAIDISRDGQTETAVSPMVLNNYARVLRELGHLDEASKYAERAYAKGQLVGHQLAINQSLLERARIYHAQHNPSRAAAMLAEVQPRLQHSLPTGHYAFASLGAEQAQNAFEKGDVPEALRLANRAVSIDEAAIRDRGDGVFYLPALLLLRSAIELAAQQPDKASADAAQALSKLQGTTQPGTFSSAIGHAYLSLGRALTTQGKENAARDAFKQAAEHLGHALSPGHSDAREAQRLADGL